MQEKHSRVELAELQDCAVAAARAAGAHALRNLSRRHEAVARTRYDVKLKLDVECQEQAENLILSRFPEHAVMGEEETSRAAAHPESRADYEWIIDPIDGTVNFAHGFRWWCSVVGVRCRGEMLAGAVFAPALDELYTATASRPACVNGTPIHVSATDSLTGAIVMTGMDKKVLPGVPPNEIFSRIAAATQKARIMGSAALDICRVACGQAEGYFEAGIYVWDVAAAGLIVQRAGGAAETIQRLENGRLCFLASNGVLHADLKQAIGYGSDGVFR